MLDSLFGDGHYSLRFLFAFIVVLALIGLTAWLVRRFGAERLGTSTARGRQPRLAVIDAAAVDGRRRLVLIRRDNVEHLIMIGGPSDIVIEPSIVRAAAAARDVAPARAAAHGDGTWAPQPEPAPAMPAMPRIVRPAAQQPIAEDPAQWDAEPPPLPRQGRAPDPLAGLAAELSRNPPPQPEPAAPPPPMPRAVRPREAAREPEPPRPAARPPQPAMPPEAQFAPSPADQNLAEMAQRLEAALRRPMNRPDARTDGRADGRQEPKLAAVPPPEPPPPEREPPLADPRQMPGEGRREARAAAAQGKSPYDSLEQEMASLLGRNSKA